MTSIASPDIAIFQGHAASPRRAEACVVIDVIRAFTVADIAFRRGASSIKLVADVDAALGLRAREPELLVIGERDGLPIAGFDLGNSPAEMSEAIVAGRRLVQRTSHGVQALVTNRHASLLLATGFSQIDATAAVLQGALAGRAARVDLIASHPDSDEDMACAEHLRGLLLGVPPDPAKTVARIRASRAAAKFQDPDQRAFDPRDLALCVETAPVPLAMRAEAAPDGYPVLRPLAPESSAGAVL